MAPSAGTLRVGRYFAVLLGLFVVLYGIVFWPHQPRTPKLGLDLEGGAQVILKAETSNGKSPTKSSMDQARQIITNRVNGLGVSSAEVVTQGNDRIVVSVPGASANDIKDVGGTALLQFRPLLPIFDSTGQQQTSIPVTPPSTAAPSGSGPATTAPTGSASAKASGTGSASSTAKATGSSSAHGRVVPLAAGSTSPAGSATPSATPSGSATPLGSGSATPSASSTADPSAPIDQWKVVGFTPPSTPAAVGALSATQKSTLYSAIESWPCNNTIKPLDVPTKPIITCDQKNSTKYLLGPVIVAGTEVKTAAAVPPGAVQGQFQWTVTVDLKPKGQSAWASYTSKHNVTVSPDDVGNQVADTLDSKVIVASTIQGTINGTTQITGTFTAGDANNLANSLKYGALPLNFVQQAATSISPTLGTDQLKAGLLAGGIGLFLVVVYSLIYYRALGLVTIASLVVSGGLTYAMLVVLGKQIGFTLTLSGIAGFIVAVGITADSFVVFFERIKDEVHEGRTARVAIPRAWERSRRTILSADTVSFLAAATLYYFAAGDVKGFAFTLGLSTILDLVVVFLFTHPLVALFSRSAAFGSAKFTGLDHVRPGGIASRDQRSSAPELVAAGVGSTGSVSRPAASSQSATSRSTGAATSRSKPTVDEPVVGETAAERAAARRARRATPDTSTEDGN
ncbi:MAG: protein translocase subunit SecD [Actinomycetota bacterium]|nr:protein translocase subunit SecD [Actinomycetota bacterium]